MSPAMTKCPHCATKGQKPCRAELKGYVGAVCSKPLGHSGMHRTCYLDHQFMWTWNDKPCTDIRVPIGTILNYSIGCGCDEFWQVVEATPKSVKARRIDHKVVNRNIRCQTCDYVPVKDKFLPPNLQHKCTKRNKAGYAEYKEVDKHTVILRVADEPRNEHGFRIGPEKRMMWWSVWDGKAKSQWSS